MPCIVEGKIQALIEINNLLLLLLLFDWMIRAHFKTAVARQQFNCQF